jgi:competence protein ComEA
VAFVCAAPSAHSSSKKKTPTPVAETASTKTASSDKAKTEKVNLNTADEKDIAAAKGVGAKLAKALVAGRPYKTWEDVSKVKGVGSGKKLDSLKKVLKLTDGVAAKDEAAVETKTKTKKSKSSSKVDETSSAASGGGAGGGAAGGAAAGSGNASAPSSPSSPSKKSSSSSSSSSKLAPGTKININTASAEELDKLPEIGPVKAKAIVDYRDANGKFETIEDIMKVSGIKEGTFAKIKDFIVVR